MLVYSGVAMNGGEQEALTSPDASMWKGFYFFIGFVIIGGFAIQATSSFPGLQQYNQNSPLISELDLAFIGSEIIDIEYYDSDWEHSHIAIIENSIGERILYDQSSSGNDGVSLIAKTGMGTINADNLTTILEFKDDIFWISDAPGKLTRVELGESFTSVSFDGDLGASSFVDISLSPGDENKMLLLTRQGSNSEVWGSSSEGLLKVENDHTGVNWLDAEPISPNHWLITGISTPSFSESGNSPATPTQRGVIGIVTFEDSNPFIEIINTTDTTVHSIESFSQGVVVSTEDQFWYFENKDEFHNHAIISAKSQVDSDGVVWFFSEGEFEYLQRYDTSTKSLDVVETSGTFNLYPTFSSATETHVYIHGTDGFGEDSFISMDLTYAKSLQSGRGFLNWAFMMGGSAMLVILGMFTLRGISGEEF